MNWLNWNHNHHKFPIPYSRNNGNNLRVLEKKIENILWPGTLPVWNACACPGLIYEAAHQDRPGPKPDNRPCRQGYWKQCLYQFQGKLCAWHHENNSSYASPPCLSRVKHAQRFSYSLGLICRWGSEGNLPWSFGSSCLDRAWGSAFGTYIVHKEACTGTNARKSCIVL